jgi:hypothetical protein
MGLRNAYRSSKHTKSHDKNNKRLFAWNMGTEHRATITSSHDRADCEHQSTGP